MESHQINNEILLPLEEKLMEELSQIKIKLKEQNSYTERKKPKKFNLLTEVPK